MAGAQSVVVHVPWPRPFPGPFAIRGLAPHRTVRTINLCTKFEVYLHPLWRCERRYTIRPTHVKERLGCLGVWSLYKGHWK